MAAVYKITEAQLAKRKIQESGLTQRDAKALGLKPLRPEQTAALGHAKLPALQIPYFETDGKPRPFYRIRYLQKPKGFGGAGTKRWHKYTQPPNEGPQVYFPPLNFNWCEVIKDKDVPLYLTEGELKAACGVRHGFATIGLGGVYNWRSASASQPWIPDLQGIQWKDRQVFLVFDSDSDRNEQVRIALVRLARELMARGARPYVVKLPTLEGMEKTGLDDYLVATGPEDFIALTQEADPFSLAEELWQLNTEVVYIRSPGIIVSLGDGRRLSASAFVEHAYANRHYYEELADGKIKKKPAAKAWLAWEHRFELDSITYRPGEEKILEDDKYNLWNGWGCQPVPGDIEPWDELLSYVFKGAPKERHWFEQWCAYQFQCPGVKLYSAVLIWGRTTGTGKTLIGETLGRIFGQNFEEIQQADLLSQFNEWAVNKQFIMGSEIVGTDQRKEADTIKNLITRERIRIKEKYLHEYTLPDVINYYFTSNHPDAFFIDDQDRRLFVWELNQQPLEDSFYDYYDHWMRTTGPEHLFDYLLHYDITGFNPKARPPLTTAKEEMVYHSRSDLSAWVALLKQDPDSAVQLDGTPAPGDLFTNHQLRNFYDPDGRTRVTTTGLGRELKRQGILQRVVKMEGAATRLYAVRNADHWARQESAAWVAHVEERVPKPPRQKY